MALNPNAILPKRGTAAQWSSANPVLGSGETGYETDTKRSKRGDGATTWNSLPYQLDKTGADSLYSPTGAVQPDDIFDSTGAIRSSLLPAPPENTGTIGFTWAYSSSGENAMASGVRTFDCLAPATGLVGPCHLQQDDISTGVATVVDLEIRDSAGNWSSAYGAAALPTIPAGQDRADGAAPLATAVTKGQLIRARLAQAPPTATAGGSAATHPFAGAGYGNNATTKTTSHTIPMPTAGDGATINDVVLLIIPLGNIDTDVNPLPAGWRTIASSTTTPNGRLNVRIMAAQWTPTLANTFVLGTQLALLAEPILLRGVNIDSIGQVAFSDGAEQTGVPMLTPSFVAAAAADFLIPFVATYFAPGVDNYRQDWTATGGLAGLTKAVDLLTTQGATVIDYGLAVGFANGVAAGATVPSQSIGLATGGTGATGTVTSIRGVIAVRRSAGTRGPSRIVAQWNIG